jgi:hypothetical protein
MAAILRYNNSMPYAQNVLGWAAAYATGVVPVDLPPMTGPPPPLGDAFFEHPEGLGPNLPMNINGLPSNDPLARVPLIDLSAPQQAGPPPAFPWMTPTQPQQQTRQPGCTVICIGSQTPPPPPWQPQGFGAPPPDAVSPAAPPPSGAHPAPDPLAGGPAGPPPGGPPAGPAQAASPSPKPAGPPPTAATAPGRNQSAPNSAG